MIEPFLLNALIAGLGLSVVTAPLGCFVVWQRMAFFGETIAQASLIGIALGLLLNVDLTGSALIVALLTAGILVLLTRQQIVPVDALLGMLAHAALAVGVIATALVRGPGVDLMGYLFGDIFAISGSDIAWVLGGGAMVLAASAYLWQPLLAIAVHEELAVAEGVPRDFVKTAFVVLLALAIAVAMKIVGILLAVAFLIMPAAAARPISRSPEQMVLVAAGIACLSVVGGLALSVTLDTPGGPSIVVVLAAIATATITAAAVARRTRA
jgi:zinc transport system permease protein